MNKQPVTKQNEINIIQFPNDILRMNCDPVPQINKHIKVGVELMKIAMAKFGGVGLAAPQIGWPVRIFIHRAVQSQGLFEGKVGPIRVYINPEITFASDDLYWDFEECLSIPWARVNVQRAKQVRVKAKNLDGYLFEDIYKGFAGRVVQHELDHLNGVVILDKENHISPWQKKND